MDQATKGSYNFCSRNAFYSKYRGTTYSNFWKLEYIFSYSYGSSASKGVSILISKTLNYDIIVFFIDNNGRYVLLNIEISKNVYSLLNVYAPNDKTMRNTFF